MKHKSILDQEYTGLCQKLGHLVSNKEKIEAEIEQLKKAISSLDRAGEILAALDKAASASAALKAEAASGQKQSQ